MSGVGKFYTTLEIEQIRTWRTIHKWTTKKIAETLKRPLSSVRQICHRERIVTQPKADYDIRERIKQLHLEGDSTDLIRSKLEKSKRVVRGYLSELGLKANKPKTWRNMGGNYFRPRCFGCDVLCPIRIIDDLSSIGWEIHKHESQPGQIYFCKECIKQGIELGSIEHKRESKFGEIHKVSFNAVVVGAVVLYLHGLGFSDGQIAFLEPISEQTIRRIREMKGLKNNRTKGYKPTRKQKAKEKTPSDEPQYNDCQNVGITNDEFHSDHVYTNVR